MRELLVATTNPGKFSEIMEILEYLPFSFIFLGNFLNRDSSLRAEFESFSEDGETYRENAYKKAAFFAERTGMMTLAEDSGVVVSALEGELGVKTRRWGVGEKASDEEWIEFFMKRMGGEQDRRAKFVCCACLVGGRGKPSSAASTSVLPLRRMSTNTVHSSTPRFLALDGFPQPPCVKYFEGETLGLITDRLMAPLLPGLPLSSCFLPEGFTKVYAAMSKREKNMISHRGKAMFGVREFLKGFVMR